MGNIILGVLSMICIIMNGFVHHAVNDSLNQNDSIHVTGIVQVFPSNANNEDNKDNLKEVIVGGSIAVIGSFVTSFLLLIAQPAIQKWFEIRKLRKEYQSSINNYIDYVIGVGKEKALLEESSQSLLYPFSGRYATVVNSNEELLMRIKDIRDAIHDPSLDVQQLKNKLEYLKF
jgi:hypothetical protein